MLLSTQDLITSHSNGAIVLPKFFSIVENILLNINSSLLSKLFSLVLLSKLFILILLFILRSESETDTDTDVYLGYGYPIPF